LKSNGYPELADVEARLGRSYEKLSTKSLRTRLAYSAGFECMTNGITTWFINKRTQLFAHASPVVSSFWLMHMIEERYGLIGMVAALKKDGNLKTRACVAEIFREP
jgi:hypothetical protein